MSCVLKINKLLFYQGYECQIYTLNSYDVAKRFSEFLMNGNVCEIILSIIVHPKTIPTQTIFVCRIKTLKNPVK